MVVLCSTTNTSRIARFIARFIINEFRNGTYNNPGEPTSLLDNGEPIGTPGERLCNKLDSEEFDLFPTHLAKMDGDYCKEGDLITTGIITHDLEILIYGNIFESDCMCKLKEDRVIDIDDHKLHTYIKYMLDMAVAHLKFRQRCLEDDIKKSGDSLVIRYVL